MYGDEENIIVEVYFNDLIWNSQMLILELFVRVFAVSVSENFPRFQSNLSLLRWGIDG